MHNSTIDVFQKGLGASDVFDYGMQSNDWSPSNRPYCPTAYGNNLLQSSNQHQSFPSNYYGLDDHLSTHQSTNVFSTGSTESGSAISSPPSMPSQPQHHPPTQKLFTQLANNNNLGYTDVSSIEKEIKEALMGSVSKKELDRKTIF